MYKRMFKIGGEIEKVRKGAAKGLDVVSGGESKSLSIKEARERAAQGQVVGIVDGGYVFPVYPSGQEGVARKGVAHGTYSTGVSGPDAVKEYSFQCEIEIALDGTQQIKS